MKTIKRSTYNQNTPEDLNCEIHLAIRSYIDFKLDFVGIKPFEDEGEREREKRT
jgi:hypothetical protein